MIDAPLAIAFAAGLIATVNPCGFAMLPAYLSYFMGIDDHGRRGLAPALGVGAVVSAGFMLVFGVVGTLIALGVRSIITLIPWFALAVGVGVLALGVAMLAGFELNAKLPKIRRGVDGKGFRSMFVFGVSYAVASLSCTLPVFLTVVAAQATRTNLISGIVTFLVYGLGMSLVLVGLTVALAVGRDALVRRLRGAMRYVNRISAVILVLTGAYIVWFWIGTLRSGGSALGGSGPFRLVEAASQWAQSTIGRHPLAWAVGLVVVTVAGLAVLARRERRAQPEVLERVGGD